MTAARAMRGAMRARRPRGATETAMQKILVARPIFPDVIERLKQYFDVDWNDGDALAPMR